MRITGWGAALLGSAALTLAMATPAAANEEGTPELAALAEQDGMVVTQAACEDGGKITITAQGITYYVSSGTRTAGLAARIGGAGYAQEQEPADDGAHVADETLVVPAPAEDSVLEYRWFAGPNRDDLPAWNATSPADEGWDAVLETIVELEADQERPWDARDTGDFVNWYKVDVTGCPAPESTVEPTAGAEPPPAAGEGGEADDELPVTGLGTGMLALAAAGVGAVGAGLYVLARRRRVSFHA